MFEIVLLVTVAPSTPVTVIPRKRMELAPAVVMVFPVINKPLPFPAATTAFTLTPVRAF